MPIEVTYRFKCDFCQNFRDVNVKKPATPIIRAVPKGWKVLSVVKPRQHNKYLCPEHMQGGPSLET